MKTVSSRLFFGIRRRIPLSLEPQPPLESREPLKDSHHNREDGSVGAQGDR